MDVVVIGAGPAGALLARQLALLGHAVALVHGGAGRVAERRLETLAPSVPRLLHELGLSAALQAAALGRPRPAWVRWDLTSAGAAGGEALQCIDREHFDAALRDAAVAAGARLHSAWAGEPTSEGQGWRVPLRGATALQSTCVADARGRRVAALQGTRTRSLMAVCEGGLADGVWVERWQHGWAWAAAAVGRAVVAAFVDDDQAMPRGAAAQRGWLQQQLRASAALAPWASGVQATQVHDASARAVADAAPAPGLLRLGDAAVALNPLSSQGVAAALRGALQAAACLHTALSRPASAALAWRFHREQQRRVAQQHQHLVAEAMSPAAPAAQRAWPPLHATITLDPAVRCEPQPVLEDGFIVERLALQRLDGGAPAAWLAGEPVQHWLDALQGRPTLAELLDRWQARFGSARTQAVWPRLWQQGLVNALD